jgi:hypothetical protein
MAFATAPASAGCGGTVEKPDLGTTGFRWHTAESAHFRLHADSGSWAAERLDSLGLAAESARSAVLAALGEPVDSVEPKPEIFFLDGPDDFRALVGQPAGGWTEPRANTVLLGASPTAAPPLRHELAHLYSHRRWGPPGADWVSEGVAVYGVGGCAGAPLHAWALAVRKAGISTPLDTLEIRFDFSKAAPHLEAASFVDFLRDRYGQAAVRALWTDGLAGAAEATRQSAALLETEWRAHVTAAEPALAAGLDPRGRVRCETGG